MQNKSLTTHNPPISRPERAFGGRKIKVKK